jgi:putative ABC transport system permease protein
MKFLPLLWAGLWRKPMRTVFTFLSIVLAFVLFGLLTGVDQGFTKLRETARLDRLMSDSRFGAPLPISYGPQIERIPGVTVVATLNTYFCYVGEPKNGLGVAGTDEKFFAARPEITATKEQIDTMLHTRTGAITTVAIANKYGWKAGDTITLQSPTPRKDGSKMWTFDLVAVVDDADHPGTGQYFAANYAYMDEARASNNGTATRFITRIKDPGQSATISAAIDGLSANSAAPTRTNSEKANTEAGLQSLGDINFLVDSVGGAVLFMLLFITGNSMMQSVRERIPEFGIMKTLGFTDRGVLLTVLAESALVFVFAALIGLLVARYLIGLTHGMNLPPLFMPWSALISGVALSVAAAVASAIVPAWRVKRIAIVDALAGR